MGALAGWISGRLGPVVAAGSALSPLVLLGGLSTLTSGPPGLASALVADYLVLLGGLAVRLVRRRRARSVSVRAG